MWPGVPAVPAGIAHVAAIAIGFKGVIHQPFKRPNAWK
jgi:hypothetical protein